MTTFVKATENKAEKWILLYQKFQITVTCLKIKRSQSVFPVLQQNINIQVYSSPIRDFLLLESGVGTAWEKGLF